MIEGRGWRRAELCPCHGPGCFQVLCLGGSGSGFWMPIEFHLTNKLSDCYHQGFSIPSPQTMGLRVQEKTWYRYMPELNSPQRPEFSRSWWTQVFAFLIRSPGGSKYIGLGESLYILEHGGDGLVAKTKFLNYCLYVWAWVKSDSLKSILQSLTGSKDILGFLNGLFLRAPTCSSLLGLSLLYNWKFHVPGNPSVSANQGGWSPYFLREKHS